MEIERHIHIHLDSDDEPLSAVSLYAHISMADAHRAHTISLYRDGEFIGFLKNRDPEVFRHQARIDLPVV